MNLLFLVLVVVVVGVPVATALALPHWLEGVLHLYAPQVVGRLAFSDLATRTLSDRTVPVPVTVPDGYRTTKQLEMVQPGFAPGVWVVGPAEQPHSRITVIDPRVAYVSVLPSSPRFAWIPRAIATVRVQLVDGSEGRTLEAKALPAVLGMTLSIPAYALLFQVGRGGNGGSMIAWVTIGMLVTAAVAAIRWSTWRDDALRKTVNALEVLENQLADAAQATPNEPAPPSA